MNNPSFFCVLTHVAKIGVVNLKKYPICVTFDGSQQPFCLTLVVQDSLISWHLMGSIFIYIYICFFNGVPGVNSNGYIYIYDSDDIISFHIMQKSDIEINWNNYWLSMVLLSMSFWLLSNSAFDPPWCPKTSRAGRAEWKGQCHRSLRRDGGKGGQLFCFEAAEVTLWEITSFNR